MRLSVGLEPGGINSYTSDLSPGGMFLVSSRVYRPGTRVRLVVRTPAGPVFAEGVVRWAKRVPVHLIQCVRGGMGIEFAELPAELDVYLRSEVTRRTRRAAQG